jgi:hypothetical protein
MATIHTIARHLWHVKDGARVLGAIRRVTADRDTFYLAQPDGTTSERWERCQTFETAQAVLEAIAGGCVAPSACTCKVCVELALAAVADACAAPNACGCKQCAPILATLAEEPAAEPVASRWSALEID